MKLIVGGRPSKIDGRARMRTGRSGLPDNRSGRGGRGRPTGRAEHDASVARERVWSEPPSRLAEKEDPG